jgi:hypothetical protein
MVPGSVTVTELPLLLAFGPMKPLFAAKTFAPLLTIIRLFELNAPIFKSSALLHVEPTPVIKRQIVAGSGVGAHVAVSVPRCSSRADDQLVADTGVTDVEFGGIAPGRA